MATYTGVQFFRGHGVYHVFYWNCCWMVILQKLWCVVCNVCSTLCITKVQCSIEQTGLSEQYVH